jgi:uncharacterized protein (TIGR04222 family)
MIDRLSGRQTLSVATPGLGPVLEIQPQLYQRICAYELNDPSHEIGFLAHLMRANGWSRLFALRAIEEYRKFVFLALVADQQVTPSDQVDQVWHLHLLFSDAYWNDFCPRVLGRPLHHHPTKGGQAERDRFHELYRATIRSYRQHFGEPPADLWPPVDVRFGRDLQMQRGRIRRPFRPWRGWPAWRRWRWSVPMGGLLIGLGVIGSALAAAAEGARSADPPPESGDLLLGLLVMPIVYITSLMLGLAVSSWLLRPLLLHPSGLSDVPQLDYEDIAFLSAGPTRVLELGLASLVLQGVLRPNPSTRTLELIGRNNGGMPDIAHQMLTVHRQWASLGSTEIAYANVATLSRYDFSARKELLQSQKLLLIGLAKNISAWSGHPFVLIPMFFLIVWLFMPNVPPLLAFLLPPCFLGLGLGIKQPSGRTLWGDTVLHCYQSASAHADPLLRIALLGPAAMTGGRLDDLRSLIKNVEADIAADAAACGC